jgi:hypothetical protein
MAYRTLSHSSCQRTLSVLALVGVFWAGLLSLPYEAVAAGFTLMSESGEIETGGNWTTRSAISWASTPSPSAGLCQRHRAATGASR